MKITAPRAELNKTLAIACRGLSNRSTLPVLNNVLFQASEDGTLKMTATDMNTAIYVTMQCEVTEPGECALPGAQLLDIISKMGPQIPVTIEESGNHAHIYSGKSDYKMLGLSAEDYPVIPDVTDGYEFTVPQKALRDALQSVTFAASEEESRSLLMGVLFDAKGSSVNLVATNTHHLALKRLEMGKKIDHCFSVIIPALPLTELSRILGDSGDVTVTIGTGQCAFQTDTTRFIARLLDGKYPNYDKVIPKEHSITFTISREALLSALKRVATVFRTKDATDKFVWTAKQDLLKSGIELTAETQEAGRAFEELPCEIEGGDIIIAFNVRYWIEGLETMGCEKISVTMKSPLNPITVRAVGDDSFLWVCMPMQV